MYACNSAPCNHVGDISGFSGVIGCCIPATHCRFAILASLCCWFISSVGETGTVGTPQIGGIMPTCAVLCAIFHFFLGVIHENVSHIPILVDHCGADTPETPDDAVEYHDAILFPL